MYKDRGIIKWAPFDALVGFHELIQGIIDRKNRIDHPILLEDKLRELNEIFLNVLKNNLMANYTYYENGYIKETFGYILRFDEIKKEVKLDTLVKLKLDDILDIKII
ncbi:YolD-like family protein [Acholeplasma hippikon]|nr:YolD-like family protein [Acholeplasma hippikon]